MNTKQFKYDQSALNKLKQSTDIHSNKTVKHS